jgi:outer membrane protein assembly factor BamD (BamD/ComL family)
MIFLRQWLLILFALVLGGETIIAASAREDREYAAAAGAFQDGMYDRATNEFAQFAERYPNSTYVAEAVLLRAQAELKLGEFTNSIALLTGTNNMAKAGKLADEYFYWAGEAQFQSTNYLDAAETWIALSQKFPESRLRLQSVVEAASAFTKIPEWQQVAALLTETDGVFQRSAQKNPGSEQVVRGELLLAQAKFKLEDFPGASAILEPLLDSKTLKPELRRQGALLLYQVKLAAGETHAALAVTTNLLQIARLEKNNDWIAEGVALQAGALEKLERPTEAIAAYQENLANAPVEWQREAVLKIAALAIAQKQFSVATNALEQFLAQFPDSPSADIATLTLAELQLKNYVAQPTPTNQLSAVQTNFDQFISTFTNSPLLGKAYLDRGWCNWLAAKYSESFDDFKTAAQEIAALQQPPSEDLLVAWFKMGDAQFAQGDFAGALENYRAVLDSLKLFPEASATLGDRALYQGVRASVKLNDLADATNMMAQLLEKFPASKLTPGGALLVAESQTDLTPANARESLENFEAAFTNSSLRPQVELAMARTYEREQNWAAAITNYENWLNEFPTNDLRPQASYSLAQAYFQAGNETNAFAQFTNFVAQFPTNALAPLAQWWVADHFFRAGDFANAERNYKYIFQNTNWQSSLLENQTKLFYPAQMMAGRAAMGRGGYQDAIGYFTSLTADTNCPPELDAPARFAYGSILMLMNSTDTNNPFANFQAATNMFGLIAQSNPTNEWNEQAMIATGDCNLQMNNFDAATNSYALVFNSPFASVSARSQAQIGFGIALEKKAEMATGNDQRTLLELAKNNYMDVLFTKNLRDDEIADSFWVEKAGLQAATAAETLGEWEQAKNIYREFKKWLPQLSDSLDKKIAGADTHLPQKKN